MGRWALVIHGGAGLIQRPWLRAERERAYRAALTQAIETGADLLSSDGTAVDCVEAVICALEDDPLFNAGRGAVFTAAGNIELDASIMDGETLSAGAVASVTRTRHPISLARRLMERSPYVMLSGRGADVFSEMSGLEQVAPDWFHTQARWQSLAAWLARNNLPIPQPPATMRPACGAEALIHDEGKFGTARWRHCRRSRRADRLEIQYRRHVSSAHCIRRSGASRLVRRRHLSRVQQRHSP